MLLNQALVTLVLMNGLMSYYYFNSRPVNGFICFTGLASSARVCNSITICNPITRQTVKLNEITNKSIMFARQEWRKIENTTVDNYSHVYQGICIDGAIYYGIGESNIVKFDARSEKMELIKTPEESYISITSRSTLVNYNGRLGGVEYDYCKEEIRLWILEDVEKQEWSRNTFRYPCEWKGFGCHLESKVVIHTGELMMFQPSLKEACVYYYDFNKENSRKVAIQGVETDELLGTMLYYPGFVDNTRFLGGLFVLFFVQS
ncbi:hypothetical protein N665_0045s0107 [Sinapis alba]|nr:hypothetical protein N665_0045s0107 [Sinapis alba]